MSHALSPARHKGPRALSPVARASVGTARHRAAHRHHRSGPAAVAGVLTLGVGILAAPLAAQAVTPVSAVAAGSTPVASAHGGVARVGQALLPGHSLTNRGIRLYLSHSGNLELFSARGSLLWTSKTSGHHDATASMQADGNFVLRTAGGTAFWSSHTGIDGSRLIVLKSSVVAVQTHAGRVVWSQGAPAVAAVSSSPQSYAISELPKYGWSSSQFGCLKSLWTRESGWNYRAENPSSGAYGIPQSLPGSKMASAGSDWRSNPQTQIRWGLSYIKSSYGSPCSAWGHSEATGWY